LNNLNPTKLYEQYREKKINRKEFLEHIITLCEYSESENTRLECLELIDSVGTQKDDIFNFLEDKVISDPDNHVKIKSLKLIIEKFPDRGINLIKLLLNSNISQEIIAKICKVIGETIIARNRDINKEYANIIEPLIVLIFNNYDVLNFENLWGEWFHKVPEEYWNFLLEIEDPIGILEIWDYYINKADIYNWFLTVIFRNITLLKLLQFMNNTKFSGRLLYILSYLAEEIPPIRYFQIVHLFNEIGKNLNQDLAKYLMKLVRKNNLYDFALIVVFKWFENFKLDFMKELFFKSNLNIIFNLKEITINNKFGFFEHEYFMHSVFSFLVKIQKDLENPIIYRFYEELPINFKSKFINFLLEILNTQKDNEIEMTQYKKAKIDSNEIIKTLSEFIDLKKFNIPDVNDGFI
jgi:hypothetical protein